MNPSVDVLAGGRKPALTLYSDGDPRTTRLVAANGEPIPAKRIEVYIEPGKSASALVVGPNNEIDRYIGVRIIPPCDGK